MIKNISFTNSRNEEITGILKEKNRSGSLIIVCHGYKSSKEHSAIAAITDKLYAMGDSTFSFNFSKSAQEFNLQQQLTDLVDIITFFKHYKKVVLLAGSFGALTGAIAAQQSSKIVGLITVNGFFGTNRLGSKLLRFYFLFKVISYFNERYKDNWNFFRNNFKPEEIQVDTLVIHAKHDKEVSISQSKDFFEQVAGKKEFYILQTADHHLTHEDYREETAKVIDTWLKKY